MGKVIAPSASVADRTRAARLRRWVLIIGVVAIVVNATAVAYDQWRSYRQAIDDTTRELANVARILAAQTAGNLRTIDDLLRGTVEWYAREGATAKPGTIDEALLSRAAGLPQLLCLSMLNARGTQLYRSRLPLCTVVNITDRSYFVAHRDHAGLGLFVSEPIMARAEQYYTIALSRRLNDGGGEFAGVVVGFVDLNLLQQFYHEINLGPHSAIALLRDEGDRATLVLREPPLPNPSDHILEWPIPARTQIGETAATTAVAGANGAQRFVAVKRMDNFPLSVAVMRDEAAALYRWRSEALRAAARTLALSLLAALAIAALARQLRRVALRAEALRESEERYSLAMEGANAGHFDWNLQGGPSFLSTKMKALLGLAPDARAEGRAQILAAVDIYPDDRLRIDAAFEDHLRGRTASYELKYRVRHAGEWRWLQVRGRCLHDQANKP